MIITCIIIGLSAIIYEALKWFRATMERKHALRWIEALKNGTLLEHQNLIKYIIKYT